MNRTLRRILTHRNYKTLLEIRLAMAETENALARLKKLKRRQIFDNIALISPLEVCIDRAEGLLKIQKILTQRVEGTIE